MTRVNDWPYAKTIQKYSQSYGFPSRRHKRIKLPACAASSLPRRSTGHFSEQGDPADRKPFGNEDVAIVQEDRVVGCDELSRGEFRALL